MNLKEEMKKASHFDFENDTETLPTLAAIRIAKEYAEKMCKKQIENDKNALLKHSVNVFQKNGYGFEAVAKTNILALEHLSTLATEENDEKT